MLKDTWAPRDLPVLQAIVAMTDEGADFIESHQVVERAGMDPEDVRKALGALVHTDPPYFTCSEITTLSDDPTEYDGIHSVTGHARRTVGTWPTPESLAREIIAGLEQAADDTEDEEEASRLRRTAKWFGSAGRDVLVGVVASVLAGGVSS